MIFANGKFYDYGEQKQVLDSLEEEINDTRAHRSLSPDIVIGALCRLAEKARGGAYREMIASLGLADMEKQVDLVLRMLSRENLEFRLKNELGDDLPLTERAMPAFDGRKITRKVLPLGTLFHIAAGNADGLPTYSLAEGLLCGNVNILKLPMADNSVSIRILADLVEEEPRLAPFIYVFDTPSEDIATMKTLADMSDGIVLWGGEAAEVAVRKMAPVGTKLIVWGHKLSFAYVSDFRECTQDFPALAEHIVFTKQLLCSSCQNILVDTGSREELEDFCRQFFPHLKKAAEAQAMSAKTIGDRAERTLLRYTRDLEEMMGAAPEYGRFEDENCGMTISSDENLELSPMFGHVVVKAVPRDRLFRVLRNSKGVLQTAGLLCPEDMRQDLCGLLFHGGITKVTRAGTMSDFFFGESHDGEFPLRRYIRIVCEEA